MKTITPNITPLPIMPAWQGDMLAIENVEMITYPAYIFKQAFPESDGCQPVSLTFRLQSEDDIPRFQQDCKSLLKNTYHITHNIDHQSLTLTSENALGMLVALTRSDDVENTIFDSFWPNLQTILTVGSFDLKKHIADYEDTKFLPVALQKLYYNLTA